MKRTLVFTLGAMLFVSPVWAETVHIGLNGLVCAFCAKGIEKTFSKNPATQSIHVDLDKKLATLVTKDGQTLDDAAITKTIADAGYSVTTIHRQD